ncbi:MAG: NADH-quinone oxidoreductase subunit NuoE [Candidatus Hydrogenedentota bacterium]
MTVDIAKIDSFINKNEKNQSALISVLQDIQKEYNWLPQEALIEVAKKLNVPLVYVYGVATFYKSFSLKPRGKHIITVCLGTACHVRNAQSIVDAISRKLGIKPGETTSDLIFSLETVNCLGCCAIGPIVMVDNKYYGEMSVKKVDALLTKLCKKGN